MTNQTTAELIEEARLWPRDGVNEGQLINSLADAWLAEHDAKVRVETLRNFADSIPGDIDDPRDVADLARGVADHIEKSESEAREVFEDWLAEQMNREPSEEAVEKAAIAIGRQESCVNPKTGAWYSDVREATRDRFRGYARAALIAAQEVQDRGN